MSKLFLGLLLALVPAVAFAQSVSSGSSGYSGSSYELATITGVKPYDPGENVDPQAALYEVSVKVGRTYYVVLTTSPDHSPAILYAVGRQILVLVGENTITWNDIMGQSHEVAIQSRSLMADASGR